MQCNMYIHTYTSAIYLCLIFLNHQSVLLLVSKNKNTSTPQNHKQLQQSQTKFKKKCSWIRWYNQWIERSISFRKTIEHSLPTPKKKIIQETMEYGTCIYIYTYLLSACIYLNNQSTSFFPPFLLRPNKAKHQNHSISSSSSSFSQQRKRWNQKHFRNQNPHAISCSFSKKKLKKLKNPQSIPTNSNNLNKQNQKQNKKPKKKCR